MMLCVLKAESAAMGGSRWMICTTLSWSTWTTRADCPASQSTAHISGTVTQFFCLLWKIICGLLCIGHNIKVVATRRFDLTLSLSRFLSYRLCHRFTQIHHLVCTLIFSEVWLLVCHILHCVIVIWFCFLWKLKRRILRLNIIVSLCVWGLYPCILSSFLPDPSPATILYNHLCLVKNRLMLPDFQHGFV
jgi:hypothetical protein